MAGDWIKMRIALADDPAVISIAARISVDEFEVVGMLHHLWGWADTQSRDGHAPGVTNVWIDRYVRHVGFADAMVSVGWLDIDQTGVTFPKFDRHNGETAKTRALAAERKRNQRNKVTDEEGQMSRSERDISVTREEKRREEKKETKAKEDRVPRFDAQAHLESLGVDSQVARDWITHRRAKKAAPTETAIDGIDKEARKAGITLQAALTISCQRGWQGFNAEWMKSAQGPPRALTWYEENDRTLAALTGRDRQHEPDDRTIDI